MWIARTRMFQHAKKRLQKQKKLKDKQRKTVVCLRFSGGPLPAFCLHRLSSSHAPPPRCFLVEGSLTHKHGRAFASNKLEFYASHEVIQTTKPPAVKCTWNLSWSRSQDCWKSRRNITKKNNSTPPSRKHIKPATHIKKSMNGIIFKLANLIKKN